MKDYNILKSKFIAIPVFLLSIVLTFTLLKSIIETLSPFGWLFIILVYAYIIYIIVSPINDFLQHKLKVSSNVSLFLSFVIVFSVLILITFFFNPIVAQELGSFSEQIKKVDLNNTFGNIITNVAKPLNLDPEQLKTNVFQGIKDYGLSITNNLIGILSNALTIFLQLILAFIFGYFYIKDGRKWYKGILSIIPKNFRDEVATVTGYFNRSATSFFRVQVFMAFVYGILNFIVMSILGINFALTASIIAFITFIIPGLGPVLSMIVPVIVSLTFDPGKTIVLLILLLVIQQIILNILIPKIYGDKVGVHPIVILLSIFVGIQLFGVVGAFIVIPIISVAVNVIGIYASKAIAREE